MSTPVSFAVLQSDFFFNKNMRIRNGGRDPLNSIELSREGIHAG